VAGTSWDPEGEAQAALRSIVADPQYGPAALSSSQTMTNLLKDLLPDAPREASVLVAASDADVASSLQNYMSQGMDLGTASRLVAGNFENRTALTPDACSWVVGAVASALRLSPPPPVVPPSAQPTRLPGDVRPTVMDAVAGVARTGSGRPSPLSIAAGSIAAVAAILVIWACALPELKVPAVDSGRHSFSIFNTGTPGSGWFAVEPVGVAILGAAAAIVMLVAARVPLLRLLATGMLAAMGIQTILLFAGYQFSVTHPDHPGGAGVVGILGGLLLLVAGVLGAVGVFSPGTPASRQQTAPGPYLR
jgi:hypothetical protein